MKKGLLAIALLICGSASAKSSDAVYEVPGFPPGSANFDMSIKLEVDGADVFARYDLPLDLTGVKNRIEVSGTFVSPGVALLQGPKGELICNFQLEQCDARYKGLNFDLDEVKQRLVLRGLPADQVELGLAISRRFEGDPIGVIKLVK